MIDTKLSIYIYIIYLLPSFLLSLTLRQWQLPLIVTRSGLEIVLISILVQVLQGTLPAEEGKWGGIPGEEFPLKLSSSEGLGAPFLPNRPPTSLKTVRKWRVPLFPTSFSPPVYLSPL